MTHVHAIGLLVAGSCLFSIGCGTGETPDETEAGVVEVAPTTTSPGYVNTELGFGIGYGPEWIARDDLLVGDVVKVLVLGDGEFLSRIYIAVDDAPSAADPLEWSRAEQGADWTHEAIELDGQAVARSTMTAAAAREFGETNQRVMYSVIRRDHGVTFAVKAKDLASLNRSTAVVETLTFYD